MPSSPIFDAANLPDTALPFVQELMLEIVRRVPANLGTPPRFAAEDLGDPNRCADSARSLVLWFDSVPDTLAERTEALEAVFGSLRELTQVLDGRVHKAVLQVRNCSEEESTFVHSLGEVLRGIRDAFEAHGDAPRAAEMLSEVLRRIESREHLGNQERADVAAHFHRVQGDLDQLRTEIARVECQTRALREQSQRDPLTGLSNRSGYEDRLAEEVARAVRYHAPLSVAVWDIDQLGAINARYGHASGDLVLQFLAGRILGALRRSDFMARVGGEEFAVILTGTAAPQARIVAKKIKQLIAEAPVMTSAGPITVSAETAAAELAGGDAPGDLHRRAVAALARAQVGGRKAPRSASGETTH